MLAETFVRAEGAFPLIGVGGIDSGAAAIAKIKAGATLVQLYTGLILSRHRAGRRSRRISWRPLKRASRLARCHGRHRRRRDHGGKLAGLRRHANYTPNVLIS